MAKVKVINTGLDQNLNGSYFNNVPSETLFSFGDFQITTNSFGRTYIDYSNTLSSFVRAVTLDTMGVTETQSENIYVQNTNVVLNLDKSNLNTFIRFGSAYEFLRVCIEEIITNYPASLFVSSQVINGGNVTYYDYSFDVGTNRSMFKVPVGAIINKFGISYKYGSSEAPNDIELRNLNLSYDKYIIWTPYNAKGNSYSIVGFTGNTSGSNYITLEVDGNPFNMVTGTSTQLDFHIKPNNFEFEEFRSLLEPYEKYIVSSRDGVKGFSFTMKEPLLDDSGNIKYNDTKLLWNTSDAYNLDIDTPRYSRFLESLLTIGAKYDAVKTDLIARFLTPTSIKTYDLTDGGKMTKLLRLYGREFDQIREFIDSIVYINKTTYNKIENIPDQLISNLSRTLGWNYFSLLNEDELVQSFLTVDDEERNLNENLLPAEIDIELWRRIIINTNYFWKTKGTREAIKSIFLLIGIPEPFINISEYVYTVDGKINPNTVNLTADDFPTGTLPFDANGYPKAPLETPDFYFQISGNTDSGQEYMNVFRQAGFDLYRTVDNRKSWVESGATYKIDDSTPQYFQKDSKLVLNSKEVDISLDTARGIEYDIFTYIQEDYKINSSGYTLPYSFVNISLGYTGNQNTFPLPSNYDPDGVLGSLEVRFNGILLNGADSGGTDTIIGADYTVDSLTKTFTLTNGNYASNSAYNRDVVQATFMYSGNTTSVTGITVSYILTRISANMSGTAIPLPSVPAGDVQLTIDGIALTKGDNSYTGDYIVDATNQQLVIQNPTLIAYLIDNPDVQVAYVEVSGSADIYARNEILKVNSFNSSKLYFNLQANKYVYRLNYRGNNTTDIKFMIDGIGLVPETDYSINPQDPYEIYLPSGIKYGSVISVYYLVGGNTIFNPVVNDVFGVGDITNLSFLEFIELIQRRMINARNRKTITDFKGGWYPSLLKIYVEYLKRSTLASDDPLLSNGYTFTNLYSFLGKYSTFFQRFVDELLSATIILRKSGLLVRNSVFTKQKFAYRRGVNMYGVKNNGRDCRGGYIYEYLGEDNALFKIQQTEVVVEPTLYVDTVTATATSSSIVTGGDNVASFDTLTSYGVQYRCCDTMWHPWISQSLSSLLVNDSYSMTINNTSPDTHYEYRAFTSLSPWGYTGLTKTIDTPSLVVTPEVHTCTGTPTSSSITGTGGYDIIGYGDVDYYAMEYKCIGSSSTTDIYLSSTGIGVASGASTQVLRISGDSWNTYNVVKDPALTWVSASTSTTLSPTGVDTCVYFQENTGVVRAGLLCYIPTVGTTKYLGVQQASGLPSTKPVYMTCAAGGSQTLLYELACADLDTSTDMSAGECYSLSIGWSLSNAAFPVPMSHMLCVDCNGSTIYSCTVVSKSAKTCSGLFTPIVVRYGDAIEFTTESQSPSTCVTAPVLTTLYLNSVTNICGSFNISSTPTYMINLTSSTISV